MTDWKEFLKRYMKFSKNSADNVWFAYDGRVIYLQGTLTDGREIAVKRLSKNSRQGLDEFKNEVQHIV